MLIGGAGCSATSDKSASPASSADDIAAASAAASGAASPTPPPNTEPSGGGVNIGEIVLAPEAPTAVPALAAPIGAPSATAAAASDRGAESPPPPPGGNEKKESPTHGRGGPQATRASPKGNPSGGVQGAVVDSGNGLSEADIRTAISARSALLRQCYSMGASADAAFKGTITLRANIGPTGTIASLEVVSSTTKNAKVDGCVMDALRGTQFPATGTGGTASIPIALGQ